MSKENVISSFNMNSLFPLRIGPTGPEKRPDSDFVLDGPSLTAIYNDRYLWPTAPVLANLGQSKWLEAEYESFVFHILCLISSARPGSASMAQIENYLHNLDGYLLGKIYPGADFAFRFRTRTYDSELKSYRAVLTKLCTLTAHRVARVNYNALIGRDRGIAGLKQCPSWDAQFDYPNLYKRYVTEYVEKGGTTRGGRQ